MVGHPNALRYEGMLADVFVIATVEEDARRQATQYCRDKGWGIERLDHVELVTSASPHDCRLSELFRIAQKVGIAALFSPYS